MAGNNNKQVCQQDAYTTHAGGAVTTMCNTLVPFSTAIMSVADCMPLSIAYCRLLQELSYRKQIAPTAQ